MELPEGPETVTMEDVGVVMDQRGVVNPVRLFLYHLRLYLMLCGS
jgi:hypothetical protein